MCGLIGVFSKQNKRASQYAFELYRKQMKRGQRGYGYIAIHDGVIVSIQRAKDEVTIKPLLMRETAETILFHHRLPTSTDNSIGTTHPIFVSHSELQYDYYLAHNGSIKNSLLLQERHSKSGYEYTTEHKVYEVAEYKDTSRNEIISAPVTKFNDSESLAIEFARYIEGLTTKIDIFGEVAFWAVAVEKGTKNVANIYYGRNHGRMLHSFESKKWFVITSETGSLIDPMSLFTFNLKDYSHTTDTLSIDEARPYVQQTMGYRTYYDDYATIQRLPPPSKWTLHNRKYTPEEVRMSGHSLFDFTAQWVGAAMMYVPNEYVEKNKQVSLNWEETQKKISKEKSDFVRKHKDPKTIERLDTLATEYADEKYKAEQAEEMLGNGKITYQEYGSIFAKHDANASMAYDLMYALGLPDEFVEETIDTAVELRDYNGSFEYEGLVE